MIKFDWKIFYIEFDHFRLLKFQLIVEVMTQAVAASAGRNNKANDGVQAASLVNMYVKYYWMSVCMFLFISLNLLGMCTRLPFFLMYKIE